MLSIPSDAPSSSTPLIAEVLVADEQRLVCESISVLCSAIPGFRVISQVTTAASALVWIEQLKPDVALLDLELSDLATTEVIQTIRSKGLKTRCATLSVRKDRKTVLEVLRAGACGFLLKSAGSEQMKEALCQVVQGGIYVAPQIEVMSLFDERSHCSTEDPIDGLSSREFQVYSLLIDGIRAKEIAARLSLSPKTIDTYRSSLMRKLDIHDVAGLVKFAIKREMAGASTG